MADMDEELESFMFACDDLEVVMSDIQELKASGKDINVSIAILILLGFSFVRKPILLLFLCFLELRRQENRCNDAIYRPSKS